jgi:hypothetical protein
MGGGCLLPPGLAEPLIVENKSVEAAVLYHASLGRVIATPRNFKIACRLLVIKFDNFLWLRK